MKNEKYYIFGTISNPFGKSQKKRKIDTANTIIWPQVLQ